MIEQAPPAAGIVIAAGAEEPFERAGDALERGVSVLWAGPAPAGDQLSALDQAAHRNAAFLRVFEPFRHTTGFALVRRFLRAPEPFWHPVYLRAVWLDIHPVRVEDLVQQQIASALDLLGLDVEDASAEVLRGRNGELLGLFASLSFGGDVLFRATASAVEGRSAKHLVAATHGKTFTLEEQDRGGRLRIVGSGQERVLDSVFMDPVVEESRILLEALRSGDTAAGNSARWLQVLRVWAALEHSKVAFGRQEVPTVGSRKVPGLDVITGGATRPSPPCGVLTLVGR
jgi:hypothetical protein